MMKHLSLPEYGRFARSDVEPFALRRLQRLDERHAARSADYVFDWGHSHEVRARNHVGVMQVEGLQVEILPKIDGAGPLALEGAGMNQLRARKTLLYMLSLTRDLPINERDLASQRIERMPLLEALISLFATRLLEELRRGIPHRYVYQEENLACIKGRLLVPQHVCANVGRHDRMYVGYDEFIADTMTNRIMKAACRRLLGVARLASTQQQLREALLELADVDDVVVQSHHFDGLNLDRSSERFKSILAFCRLVLTEATPSISAGGSSTFSLLFPMEQVFEEFVGRFIRRYAGEIGLLSHAIHLQAVNRRRWLLRTPEKVGRFRLQPDILVDDKSGKPALIIDTKWKILSSDAEDAKNGVAQSDMYQLYAYAMRFNAPTSILLYPRVAGVTPKQYSIDADPSGRKLKVEFLDIGIDLPRDKALLKVQFERIVRLATGVQE